VEGAGESAQGMRRRAKFFPRAGPLTGGKPAYNRDNGEVSMRRNLEFARPSKHAEFVLGRVGGSRKAAGRFLGRRLLLLLLMAATARAQAANSGGAIAPSLHSLFSDALNVPMPEFPALHSQLPSLSIPLDATGKSIPSKYDVSRIGDRGVGGGLDFYSLEREIAMGREMALEVEESSRVVRDPVVSEYVNRVAQTLVRNSDARVPFTVKVLDDDEINAFALPGGFFFVNTGLIVAADSEAELAGVMAHEIAHVAARHATRSATKAQLLNMLSIPLIFFGGPVGYVAQQVAGLGVPLSMLKFSRNAEREADALGLQYQYASGYDPEEFVRFMEKLKSKEKDEGGSFFSKAFQTHPMTEDRVERAQKEIERYLPPRTSYIVDTSEFDRIRARLEEQQQETRIDSGKGPEPVLRRRNPATPLPTPGKRGN
jgi:Zn-dependent protease with chaperone function